MAFVGEGAGIPGMTDNVIETDFPRLKDSYYRVTSPESVSYNCIAWAAGDTAKWWWPDQFFQYYWPSEIDRREDLETFVKAFEFLGYSICDDADYEKGYTKIAIYANERATPTHAARQLESGLWTSKLGNYLDIEHQLNSLSGSIYGSAVVFMRRREPKPIRKIRI